MGRRPSNAAARAPTSPAAPAAASSAKKRSSSSQKKQRAKTDAFAFDLDDAASASGSKKSKKPTTPLLSAKKIKAAARAREEEITTTEAHKLAARTSTGGHAAAAAHTPKPRGRPRSAHSPAIPAAAAASPSALLFTPTRRPVLERYAPPSSSASVVSSTPSVLHALSERASTPPRFGSEEKAAAAKAAKVAAARTPVARPSVTPTSRRSHTPAAAAPSASRGLDSRSSTPPSDHDRSAWASMLATADLGSIVAAPAGAMAALHGWMDESQSAGTKGSPKKRRASPKRVEKRMADEMEEQDEEEKENTPQSPAKRARKTSSVKKSAKQVREGGRRSTRHADEPRKSLKEPSDEEEEEEDRSEQEDEEEEPRSAKSLPVDEYDFDAAMDDGRSQVSTTSASRRGPPVSRFVEAKLSQEEQDRMAKAKAFFEELDSKDVSEVFEIVRR